MRFLFEKQKENFENFIKISHFFTGLENSVQLLPLLEISFVDIGRENMRSDEITRD